jgi:hypothetical protein
MKCVFGLLGLLGITAVASCGGSSDEDSAVSIPFDELPSRYADATCSAAQACWGSLLSVLLGGQDCQTLYETAISDELDRLKQAIDQGTLRYDGTKLQACIDAVKARGCGDGPEPPECTAAIDGTVALGGDCSLSAECKGADTYCKTGATCPGQCALRETAGSVCKSDDDCGAGLRCSTPPSPEQRLCFVPVAEGARCGGGTLPDCASGLFCLGEDASSAQTGTCRTISQAFSAKSGETCLINGQPFCTADLRCAIQSFDPVTNTPTTSCVAVVASGAACKLAYPDMCPIDQYCAVPPQMIDGVCTAKPGAGKPCAARGTDAADICAPGTRCDGGICRPLQHLGGSCQTDDVCYNGNCVDNGCASSACE